MATLPGERPEQRRAQRGRPLPPRDQAAAGDAMKDRRARGRVDERHRARIRVVDGEHAVSVAVAHDSARPDVREAPGQRQRARRAGPLLPRGDRRLRVARDVVAARGERSEQNIGQTAAGEAQRHGTVGEPQPALHDTCTPLSRVILSRRGSVERRQDRLSRTGHATRERPLRPRTTDRQTADRPA